jgi:hypothetical protein
MAVTFDALFPGATGANIALNGASPLTWTHTCGATANLLLVGISVDNVTHAAANAAVTYNGVAMTEIDFWNSGGASATAGFGSCWELVNPPTGSAHTVSVSFSAGDSVGGGSLSFIGYGSLGPVTTADSNQTIVSTGTGNVPTTTSGNICVCFLVDGSDSVVVTTGTKQYATTAPLSPAGAG